MPLTFYELVGTRSRKVTLCETLLSNANMANSISDHMYRMAILAMCTSDASLDISKCVTRYLFVMTFTSALSRCVMMCLVHDLAEAQGG